MQLLSILLAITLLATQTFSQSSNPKVQQVHNDITQINTRVLALTQTTQAYNGGLLSQLPLAIDFTPVYLSTRKGFYSSLLLPSPLTLPDAEYLIDHVNQTLAVNNPKAVEVLKSKKELIEKAGSREVIKKGLELLLFAHLEFSNEVARRVPDGEVREEGQRVIDVITVALEDGVESFST